MTLSTCSFLFSGVLTEIVQQIHSLRESGVSVSQAARALGSAPSPFRKSAGSSWTTPPEIALLMSRHRNAINVALGGQRPEDSDEPQQQGVSPAGPSGNGLQKPTTTLITNPSSAPRRLDLSQAVRSIAGARVGCVINPSRPKVFGKYYGEAHQSSVDQAHSEPPPAA